MPKPKPQHCVAGLIFDQERKRVALMRKNRPSWQAGKLNAIGGKIEETDNSAYAAMVRESVEEIGFTPTWEPFLTLNSGVTVYFYRAFIPDLSIVVAQEDEQIEIHDLDKLPDSLMYNMPWIIPLALCEKAVESHVWEQRIN